MLEKEIVCIKIPSNCCQEAIYHHGFKPTDTGVTSKTRCKAALNERDETCTTWSNQTKKLHNMQSQL